MGGNDHGATLTLSSRNERAPDLSLPWEAGQSRADSWRPCQQVRQTLQFNEGNCLTGSLQRASANICCFTALRDPLQLLLIQLALQNPGFRKHCPFRERKKTSQSASAVYRQSLVTLPSALLLPLNTGHKVGPFFGRLVAWFGVLLAVESILFLISQSVPDLPVLLPPA